MECATCPLAAPSQAGDVAMLLSSGTEDYFGGTYYFNKGQYKMGLAGRLTATAAHLSILSRCRLGIHVPFLPHPPTPPHSLFASRPVPVPSPSRPCPRPLLAPEPPPPGQQYHDERR